MPSAGGPVPWGRILKSGQRLFMSGGAAVPRALIADLLPHLGPLGELEVVHGLHLGPSPWEADALRSSVRVHGLSLDPRLPGIQGGRVDDHLPAHPSEVPRLFAEGVVRLDIALIQISPPDAYGYGSLGPQVELTPAACAAARTVIAQVNPALPRASGQAHLSFTSIHHFLSAEESLAELPPPVLTETHRRLGYLVAQLVDDGDTLRTGIGPVGTAVLQALGQHRHLGLHTEILGDAAMELFEQGVIDNSRKSLVPGKLVAGSALGSARLYGFIDRNPHVDLRATDFLSNPLTIARNDGLVAVTSALQVDLSGQVAIDNLGGRYRAGLGSAIEFLRGAAMSRRGRPVVALPSTTEFEGGERRSRIVAHLDAGAGAGISKADAYYVVTEHGIATLRGRSLQERALELIGVAHPDFREGLLRQAHGLGLLPRLQHLPPPYDPGAGHLAARRLHLADGADYLLRPLGPADETRLQEFFYSHSEETIARRYGFAIARMTPERARDLVSVDQNQHLALAIVELQGPRQVIRAVGRYFLDADGKGAEVAFVVAENRRRLGMARTLLERMMHVAKGRGLTHLWAQVRRDNLAMLRLFRKIGAAETSPPDAPEALIRIPL